MCGSEKVIYRFSVCVSDYILCIAWVQRKRSSHWPFGGISIYACTEMSLWWIKKVFDERSAHSKVVLDDSLITVDTTAHHLIKGLAKKSYESHSSRIALSRLFSVLWLFPYQWRNPCIPDIFFAWLANIWSSLRSLNSLQWNSQIIHFICLNPREILAKLQIKSWR